MADEAYRAVFLRVHPTGKMVLSLTTEPDGNEGRYAQLVAEELGVPALDVKVVPADETASAPATASTRARPTARPARSSSATGKIRAKAQLLAGVALERRARHAAVGQRRVRRRGGRGAGADDRRHRAVRPRLRRAAARASRAASTRRPSTRTDGWRSPRHYTSAPTTATLTVRTGKARRRREGRPQPRDRGHALAGDAGRRRRGGGSVALTADARSLRVRSGSGGMSPLGDEEKAEHRAVDRRRGAQGRRRSRSARARVDAPPRRAATSRASSTCSARPRPVAFDLDAGDDGRLTGSARFKQTDWGIKPYSALFGTLKVADDVEVGDRRPMPT